MLFAGVYVCTFQPAGNCTGEGVKKYGGVDVCNDLIGQRGRQELLVPLGSQLEGVTKLAARHPLLVDFIKPLVLRYGEPVLPVSHLA